VRGDGLVGPDAARVVDQLGGAFGQRDHAEHVVVDQHDQDVAFSSAVSMSISVAPVSVNSIGSSRRVRLDHLDAAPEAAGQRGRDQPRRAFAEIVDVGLEGEAQAGDARRDCAGDQVFGACG
jgi:hypothetical protein